MTLCQRIIIALLFLFIETVNAQDSSFTVYKRLITQTDGLPDRNLYCGLQDKYGFLWLGTRSGLCRYDGSQFIFFTPQSHGLRGSSVFSLAADDNTGIIITYMQPGSSVFSSQTRDVIDINTLQVKPMGSYYPAIPFVESEIDNIAYTAGTPLQFFPRDALYYWTYSHTTGFQKKSIQSKQLRAAVPEMKYQNKSFAQKINDHLNRDLSLQADSTLISLSSSYLLFNCRGKGYVLQYNNQIDTNKQSLYFLNYQGVLLPIDSAGISEQGFKNYAVYRWCKNYANKRHSMYPTGNQQSAIMELDDNSIVFYSAQTGFIPLFQKEENIQVSSYFIDRQGAYWLCTSTGLYKMIIKKKLFTQYFTRNESSTNSRNSVRGIYADDDMLAASLYHNILINHRKGDVEVLPSYENFAITKINNTLWLGSKFLNAYDIASRQMLFKAYTRMAEIWSIFPLTDHQLLLGTTSGLAIYEIPGGHVTKVTMPAFPEAKFIYRIFRNTQQQLMAVAENGLYILSDSGTVTDCYYNGAPLPSKRLPCHSLYDVYEDQDGIYWLGSNLEGLFRWDRRNNNFRQYGIESGLLSTIICTIQEDAYNNLWLGTDYGLARFNKKTGIATCYTMQDGIPDNEFNRSSSFKDAHGMLYFGGINGLVSFNPANFVKNQFFQNTPFALTGFQRFDRVTGAAEDITAAVKTSNKIELHDVHRSFTVSFSLLDYDNRAHRYAYKVAGLDKDWNYINEDHIRLGNLPYGVYTLRIKAQMADGNWSEQEINIPLYIIPPFYKTWWFIVISILCAALLIMMVFKMRMRLLRAKNEKLELLVNERTGALNVALNEQKAMLQEIHHRVKNNLQFIQAIIAMQINAVKNESDQLVLMDTTRRINAMALVHEMMYNRDHLESISIKEYIHELVEKLHEMIGDQQIKVHFDMAMDDVYLNINSCLALGMITSEILSNSVKHAFRQTANPVVTLHLHWNAGIKKITYTISDNGTGFDENQQDTGLGMRLIDIFSRQLKGTYSMVNQQGFLFVFTFPWAAA
jgi:two-component sensor histidine kinase/ligand-binding sensor domain-containing protein